MRSFTKAVAVALLAFATLLAPRMASAQQGNTLTIAFPGVPTGTCATFFLAVNQANGNLYDCFGGAWNLIGPSGGGGGGTVTSFSAGDLSPLFTTTVATPTSTPALSFTLSNAAQNSVFAGPPSGGAGLP